MRSRVSATVAVVFAVAWSVAAAAAPATSGDDVEASGADNPASVLKPVSTLKPASVVRLAQSSDVYRPQGSRADDAYRPPAGGSGYGSGSAYNSGPPPEDDRYGDSYRGGDEERDRSSGYSGRSAPPSGGYGAPYAPPPDVAARNYDGDDGYPVPRGPGPEDDSRYYSKNEIVAAGHGFFGSISQGLASVIEHAFKKAGRPNGYILGEDAGGAFIAGLRYGEGRLYTKDAGTHKVYWQGPSVGYDFGGAGAKTMILVYNLRDPSEVYHRFGGVEGSAYLVGGVSIQFQKYGDVVMAPIRAGVGLRLGANVGYLKYTRRPTWNPF